MENILKFVIGILLSVGVLGLILVVTKVISGDMEMKIILAGPFFFAALVYVLSVTHSKIITWILLMVGAVYLTIFTYGVLWYLVN